jgi:hypothetical protein
MADRPGPAPAEEPEDDSALGTVGLPPDHPLLARAQEALKKQLVANKTRLEDELREKQNALKASAACLHHIDLYHYAP